MAGANKSAGDIWSSFTVNKIFEKIEEEEVLRSAEGRFVFQREEKVELVFPQQIGDYLRGLSSASYYSWFLHGHKNGGRIRAQVENLFSENPVQFVKEMAEKCRAFLCPDGHPALRPEVWSSLLDDLGKSSPLFVRDGNKAVQLRSMSKAAPQRVFTVLLLAAGMNDFTEEKYETIVSCWCLMDRDLAAKDYSQPRELSKNGEILYADGLRKEALDSFRKAVRMMEDSVGPYSGETPEKTLFAVLQYRIGEMLLHGDGCTADPGAAADHLEYSASCGYLPAFHPLAMLFLQEGRGEKAAEILREGARKKDAACLRMLGNAYYTGDTLPGIEKDLNEAVRCYMEGACPDHLSAGDAQCQYMLGRILEETKRNDSQESLEALTDKRLLSGAMTDPVFWLEAAARGKNREAASLLNRLQWGDPRGRRDADAHDIYKFAKPEKICFLNSARGKNQFFARTLPAGEYSVRYCEKERMADMLRKTVEEYLDAGKLRDLPPILLMALDDDERRNMSDAIEVLQTAAGLHALSGMPASAVSGSSDSSSSSDSSDSSGTEDLYYLLSDRLRLYVCGHEKACAPVLDSACTRLGDFYIPLYLCDPEQMASIWLLDRMPLFIPCLRAGASRMDTIIFGDHPGIICLCKDAIAAAQISEIPFSLTVIGENADELEEEFRADCPGLEEPAEGIQAARPVFVKMRPESRRLQELLSVRPKKEWSTEEKELSLMLQAADYLIVYTADEDRNLTLSMFLREWYLKTDPSFFRLPFIAAYCGREERAEQFRTLSVGTEEAGFDWYNNYDIRCFGAWGQLFSYRELLYGRLEKRTRAAHLTYYGIRDEEKMCEEKLCEESRGGRENLRCALHDYYSRQYNRDSSQIGALALNYRLFSAGITFPDWHSYMADVSQKKLADRFDRWLRAEDEEGPSAAVTAESRQEVLAMQEHDRWCRSMLSRGWMPASTAQMQAYMQRGCTRHQLYLAKLHPFLCSWDELGEMKPVPTGIQRIYGYLMQQICPEKEPSDIRGIDRDNIKKTAYLLRIE